MVLSLKVESAVTAIDYWSPHISLIPSKLFDLLSNNGIVLDYTNPSGDLLVKKDGVVLKSYKLGEAGSNFVEDLSALLSAKAGLGGPVLQQAIEDIKPEKEAQKPDGGEKEQKDNPPPTQLDGAVKKPKAKASTSKDLPQLYTPYVTSDPAKFYRCASVFQTPKGEHPVLYVRLTGGKALSMRIIPMKEGKTLVERMEKLGFSLSDAGSYMSVHLQVMDAFEAHALVGSVIAIMTTECALLTDFPSKAELFAK